MCISFNFLNQGAECPYRHVPAARATPKICPAWEQGSCTTFDCPLRHYNDGKDRSKIPCVFETKPGGCQKPHCPFLHLNKKIPSAVAFPQSLPITVPEVSGLPLPLALTTAATIAAAPPTAASAHIIPPPHLPHQIYPNFRSSHQTSPQQGSPLQNMMPPGFPASPAAAVLHQLMGSLTQGFLPRPFQPSGAFAPMSQRMSAPQPSLVRFPPPPAFQQPKPRPSFTPHAKQPSASPPTTVLSAPSASAKPVPLSTPLTAPNKIESSGKPPTDSSVVASDQSDGGKQSKNRNCVKHILCSCLCSSFGTYISRFRIP